jgi:hypothetical protein
VWFIFAKCQGANFFFPDLPLSSTYLMDNGSGYFYLLSTIKLQNSEHDNPEALCF